MQLSVQLKTKAESQPFLESTPYSVKISSINPVAAVEENNLIKINDNTSGAIASFSIIGPYA